MMGNQRGQVTAEMAVLFSFVIAAFVFMGFYLQRATQGSTKSNTDQIGQQFSTEAGFKSYAKSASSERGVTVSTDSCNRYSHGVGGAGMGGVDVIAEECVPNAGAGGGPGIAHR